MRATMSARAALLGRSHLKSFIVETPRRSGHFLTTMLPVDSDPTYDVGQTPILAALFDDVVDAQQERLRDTQAQRSCRRQIENQFEPCRLFDRHIARF
jgi:hypothetical protein